MPTVYLGLGSNLGDRENLIKQAIKELSDHEDINVIDVSSLYETEPVGLVCDTWFINCVVKLETPMLPHQLLSCCQFIEKKLGRMRDPNAPKYPYQSRTIDIDILFYDNSEIETDSLEVPHPRAESRAYVLIPMIEIEPDFIHPIIGLPLEIIRKTLFDPEEVRIFEKRRV